MDHQKAPAQTLLSSLVSFCLMSRRLEDRIRRLCAQAVSTADPDELNEILQQLKAALREHTGRLRKLATKRPIPPERRHS